MKEDRFVVKICHPEWKSSHNRDGVMFYEYAGGLGWNANVYMQDKNVCTANRYAFKTRAGAERHILVAKRGYACSGTEAFEYRVSHTKDEVIKWLDEKVSAYDWTRSRYTFEVITLAEMFEEIKQNGMMLDR